MPVQKFFIRPTSETLYFFNFTGVLKEQNQIASLYQDTVLLHMRYSTDSDAATRIYKTKIINIFLSFNDVV
jgi:hypothetical protein